MYFARKVFAAVVLGLLASAAAPAQDAPERKDQDEVLQQRDGTLYVGKITQVTDKGVEMQLKSGGNVSLDFKSLAPYSVYRLKADRIDPKSAQAHFDLGEYCLAQGSGFYGFAVMEFDKAAQLDKDLADRAKAKREEAFNEDARTKFEEAKRLIAEKDYEGAERLLSALLTVYKETPWAREAQAEMVRVTDEVRKENELKKKQLEEKQAEKKAREAKKLEDTDKTTVQQVVDAIEEAKKAWADGLDWEGKANLTKADRAFKAAEDRLLFGKRLVAERLAKSTDPALVKQGKDLDKELDAWLLKTYFRLGRLWAAELNYVEAMVWLNKGLKMAPDDRLLNDLLLSLTQSEMLRRAK